MPIHKKSNTPLVLLSALAVLYGTTPAWAAEGITSSESIPENAEAASAPTYSGGIGDDEIEYIHSVQNQYDLKLLFTATNGEYLADLSVVIRGKDGKTFVSTVTKGPVLLVNLPSGNYTVSATQSDNTSREQKISVTGHSLHSYQFRFPTNDLITSENN